jgi:hypothetical protein
MGTLLRVAGWRVMIYTLDHPPAHVHFVGPEGRAKIALNCPEGPLLPIDVRGIDSAVLKRLLHVVEQELSVLCRAWRTLHGPY